MTAAIRSSPCRINGWFRQRIHIALFVAVELHKYAVQISIQRSPSSSGLPWNATPDFFAVVVKISSKGRKGPVSPIARSCQTRISRLCCRRCGRCARQACRFVQPDVVGFVVFCVNGRQEFVFRDVQPFRGSQELPSEVDGVAFEVVAEGEVAHHFKEGVVTGGVADVFQVVVFTACAYAFFAGVARLWGVCPKPRNTSLNWFMPALVNSRVGSSCGTSEEDGRWCGL